MGRARLLARQPSFEVVVAPSIECLTSIGAYVDRGSARYDVGSAWFAAVGRDAGPDLRRRVLLLSGGSDMVWAHAITMACDVPAPRTVEALASYLAAVDAVEVKLRLVGYYIRFFRRLTSPEVMRAAATGDDSARREFLRTSYPANAAWQAGLRALLPADPTELKQRLIDVVVEWDERVFRPRSDELMAAIRADADRAESVLRAAPADGDLRTVTGSDYVPEPGIRHLLLIPSVVIRPHFHIFDHHDVKVLVYPAAESSLAGDAAAPPARLTRLFRALGDSRRLRILKELSAGERRVGQLARTTGSNTTTLLHHLGILVEAGLAQRLPSERGYVLDDHSWREIQDLLAGYLGDH